MSKERMTLREFRDYFNKNAERFKTGRVHLSECVDAGWFDWFCNDRSLPRKTYSLGKKVLQIMESPMIDIDKTRVFFKNNCPLSGRKYDSFSICDMKDGSVKYWVAPKLGYNSSKLYGKANVAYEGNWDPGELFDDWKGVKKFFGN